MQSKQMADGRKTAYIEQDYFRRIVLKEKDVAGGFNIRFIKKTVLFLLDSGHDVIMEGIFDKGRYQAMFEEITGKHSLENFFFYFDISLEETIRRHNTKPNRNAFGEKELRAWYKEKDFLSCVEEEIIPESSNAEETVKRICSVSGLG